MEPGLDWDVFRAALFAIVEGQNPYLVGSGHAGFFNPPWMLFILMPLLLLPRTVGIFTNIAASFIAMIPVTRKLGFNKWQYLFIVTSWVHIYGLGKTNIEWLPWVGVLLPAPAAMLFLSIKPQSTLGFVIFVLWREWKDKGWQGVLLAVLPTAALTLLTLLRWGIPALPGEATPWNLTLFPYSLIAAIPMLIAAMRNNNPNLAAAASPFLTPYNTLHGYLPVLFASRRWIILLVIWLLSMIPLILIILNVSSPLLN